MKTKRPIDCGNEDQVCELQTSLHTLKNFWILTEGYRVSLYEQKSSESPTQHITIPKRQFDALVEWYMREQECRPQHPTSDKEGS